jgi:hypothetical protein
MGLDMYLERKSKNSLPDAEGAWEEVMYWRKANQIREWFAEHLEEGVKNCRFSYVTKENLEDLIKDCKIVLCNHSLAGDILPTSSGFFFGSTDYDEWYFKDLEETIEKLEEVIEETDWDNEDVAYYEWW